MAALTNSIVSVPNTRNQFLSGSSLTQADQCLGSTYLYIGPRGAAERANHRKSLTVQAGRDGRGLGGAGVFISGFVLGGVAIGTLGAALAPQLSNALVGERRRAILRRFPKFIYDEEKEMEKTYQKLDALMEQLTAIYDKNDKKAQKTTN